MVTAFWGCGNWVMIENSKVSRMSSLLELGYLRWPVSLFGKGSCCGRVFV